MTIRGCALHTDFSRTSQNPIALIRTTRRVTATAAAGRIDRARRDFPCNEPFGVSVCRGAGQLPRFTASRRRIPSRIVRWAAQARLSRSIDRQVPRSPGSPGTRGIALPAARSAADGPYCAARRSSGAVRILCQSVRYPPVSPQLVPTRPVSIRALSCATNWGHEVIWPGMRLADKT